MHGPSDYLVSMIVTLVIAFLIFLAIRAFMLWYWKINVIVERLDHLLAALKKGE
jgi:hypothetical protein